MALFKTKALVNGVETEVELDDAEFFTKDRHQQQLDTVVTDRLARAAKKLRGELAADPEFRKEVFAAAGIDPDKPAAKLSAEEVAKIQAQLRDSELKPLQEKLTAAEQRAQTLLSGKLEAELTAALVEAGVRPNIAARMAKLEAGSFGYDDATGMHAVKDGDGFAFAPNATKDRPYKGVADFAKEWASNKDNADFVVVAKQGGPGVTPGSGGGAGVTITRADARDHSKFKAAEAAAEKAGTTVQIVD